MTFIEKRQKRKQKNPEKLNIPIIKSHEIFFIVLEFSVNQIHPLILHLDLWQRYPLLVHVLEHLEPEKTKTEISKQEK